MVSPRAWIWKGWVAGMVTVTVVIGAAAAYALTASPLLAACEDVLKRRLAAPSSYRLIDTIEQRHDLDADQWASFAALDGTTGPSGIAFGRQQIEAGERTPALHSLFISYDALDTSGTAIRQAAHCTYIADNGDAGRASQHSVRIDGLTHSEWLAAR